MNTVDENDNEPELTVEMFRAGRCPYRSSGGDHDPDGCGLSIEDCPGNSNCDMWADVQESSLFREYIASQGKVGKCPHYLPDAYYGNDDCRRTGEACVRCVDDVDPAVTKLT